jgi:hypothetical protein
MNNIDSENDSSIHSSEERQICYEGMDEKWLNYQLLFEVFSPNEIRTHSTSHSKVLMNYNIYHLFQHQNAERFRTTVKL